MAQAQLDPSGRALRDGNGATLRLGELVLRLSDRLIVGKNNYRTMCFRDETGEIVESLVSG
jgi:hypothetical protein